MLANSAARLAAFTAPLACSTGRAAAISAISTTCVVGGACSGQGIRCFAAEAATTAAQRVTEVTEVPAPTWSTLHDTKVLRGKPYYTDAFMVSAPLSQLAASAVAAARNDGSANPPSTAVGSVAALFFGSSWFYPEKLLLDTLGAYSTANSPWAMQFQPGEDWVGFRVFDAQPSQVLLAAHEPFNRKPSGTRTWLGLTTSDGEEVSPQQWQAAQEGDPEVGAMMVNIVFGSALVEEDRNPNWSEDAEDSFGRKVALAFVGVHKWYSAFLVGGLRRQIVGAKPLPVKA